MNGSCVCVVRSIEDDVDSFGNTNTSVESVARSRMIVKLSCQGTSKRIVNRTKLIRKKDIMILRIQKN